MDRLRAMELFLSVSRTGSFTATAKQFGVSPTSASRVIADFEDYLKVKLLVRSTRQVILTEAGQEYARQIESILWSINEAESSITAISSVPQGILRVHSRTMFGLGVLTPLIPDFRKEFPEITVELTLSETLVDLRRQNIDIDFRIAPPEEAGLKRRRLFVSERYLVASPELIASMSPIKSPDDINRWPTLAYMLPGGSYVWRFKKDEKLQELEIHPRHIANNGIALLEWARRGEGIALLDDYTLAQDLEDGTLVRLLPDYHVTNTTFEEGIYTTIIDTPLVPTKIRVFLDFVTARVGGGERRFTFREPAVIKEKSNARNKASEDRDNPHP